MIVFNTRYGYFEGYVAYQHSCGMAYSPFHPISTILSALVAKCLKVFEKNFRENGRVRKDEESGKQCKEVPTLRKLPISALAETDSFMLVEAPPQSPQNTKVVFWNAG